MKILVNTESRILSYAGKNIVCAIGKNGSIDAALGREGDGKTPLGTYPLRYGFYRADRVTLPMTKAKAALVMHPLRAEDGWCDAPEDAAYNRPVKRPYPASTENLWREKSVYDVIIVLGHNDAPPIADLGSAIFLHIARKDYAPTEGCVAISKPDMMAFITHLSKGDMIEIA